MSTHSPQFLLSAIQRIRTRYESALPAAIMRGTFPRKRLRTLAQQMYVQEKWPSHIAQVYLNLDDVAIRDQALVRYILSILRAEDLGAGSGGIPHRCLAEQFAIAVGIPAARLRGVKPIPANQALMDWCDMSAQSRGWKEALAVHVACESQFEAMSRIARGLEQHYRLPPSALRFWAVHAGPLERRHARTGLRILAKHTGMSDMQSVLYCYEYSSRLLRDLYDAILEDGR